MKYYNIPIFVPHKGCPFDCVFCNQKRITGNHDEVDTEKIKKTIEQYLKTLPKNSKDVIIETAFFGGSFTGIDFNLQGQFLSAAYEYVKSGDISGIRVSTRPDYITKEILDQLKKYGVTTIELGVQSLDDEVLKTANRGHTRKQVEESVELIKSYGCFSLGLQMMTELPGDTDEKAIKTAECIIDLAPDFVRIYPTLVIKDTYLEVMYNDGRYKTRSVDEAVNLCKKLFLMFSEKNIKVIRISLQTTDEISPGGSIVAGPYDAQFKELVETEIYYDKIYNELIKTNIKNAVVYVNVKELSKAIGKKQKNVRKIFDKLGVTIKIKIDPNIKQGQILVCSDVESEGQNCISND